MKTVLKKKLRKWKILREVRVFNFRNSGFVRSGGSDFESEREVSLPLVCSE